MSKFDLFNKNTWVVENIDPEVAMFNKASGNIGQKISELKNLKQTLKNSIEKSNDSFEYKFAEELRENHPEVYKTMNVVITYSNVEVQKKIEKIDHIVKLWGDVEGRKYTWRNIAELMQDFQDYLKADYYASPYSFAKTRDAVVADLCTVKVTGNKIWDLFLEMKKNIKSHIEIQNRLYAENQKLRPVEDEDDDDEPSSY